MSSVDYNERIPNNVHLSDDRRLQRALEAWQPHFLDWWTELGPEGHLLPAERNKIGIPLLSPLAPAVRAAIEAQPRLGA